MDYQIISSVDDPWLFNENLMDYKFLSTDSQWMVNLWSIMTNGLSLYYQWMDNE